MGVLETENLRISYNKHQQIFSYPDLYLESSQCLGIVGKTARGKTTLINGLINPYFKGEMTYDKCRILGWDVKDAREKVASKIAYMPQFSQHGLNPYLRIKEHFRHMGIVRREKEKWTQLMNLLEGLKLEAAVLEKYPHQLSGGMKQRIVLGLGLMKEPKLYLLDEPSTAIDSITLKIILDFLKKEKEKNLSLVLVSHDRSFVKHLSDRVIDLDRES